MTIKTIKAYDEHDTHTVLNEAENNGNQHLANIIRKAWDACDEIDYHPEWDEQEASVIIDALNEDGQGDLADELRDELVKAYGDGNIEVSFREWWEW